MVQEEDAAEAHGREEASDRRLQQLQAALNQLEARWSLSIMISVWQLEWKVCWWRNCASS